MATKPLPPQSLLLQLLRYDPETGKLYWRSRSPLLFVSGAHRASHVAAAWNKRFADKEAFTASSHGYRVGSINGSLYLAHRVIWKMNTGQEVDALDHINGYVDDNRLANLRPIDGQGNQKNAALSRNNRSGVVGVGIHAPSGKWLARITSDRKTIILGYFDSFDDAVRVRKEAEVLHNFHPNHGRPAFRC